MRDGLEKFGLATSWKAGLDDLSRSLPDLHFYGIISVGECCNELYE